MIKKVYIFAITVLFLGAINLPVLAQTKNPSSAKSLVSVLSVKSTSAKKLSSQKKASPVIRKFKKPVVQTKNRKSIQRIKPKK